MSERVRLDWLLTGPAVAYTRADTRSAIAKTPTEATLAVGEHGLAGDEQGDLRVHGGPEKAIHHYPHEHYGAWADELGEHPLLAAPGAFGENFSTCGWREQDVCLGDRVRAGSALLEVSQGRMPCWKLSDRFDAPMLAARVQESGRTGWYYRVLEPGRVRAGDWLERVERPLPEWPLARLTAVLFSTRIEPTLLRDCLALPLAASWRRTLTRRLESGVVEDWSPRLLGPR